MDTKIYQTLPQVVFSVGFFHDFSCGFSW
jgi:hypothetical protein